MLAVALVPLLISLQKPSEVRLYEGLGTYHRKVSTSVPLASRYIDQGFDFLYGFQYRLANQSFSEAVRLDPNLVIGYWGVAAANANYINDPEVSPEASKKALAALTKARGLSDKGAGEEDDLVTAAFARFSPDGPQDRAKLDKAYSDKMRELWAKYPTDPDVGALFAESLLNLRPWKQWTLDGRPEPGTQEALAVLKKVLSLDPKHPQGLHLWIHTMEGSQTPERAIREADRLMDLQPGLVHMQHMPAHIYNRTGAWSKSIEANTKSISLSHRLFPPAGSYLDYAHARHSLAYAAAMKGQSELAIHNANQIFDGLGDEVLKSSGDDGDYYLAMRTMFLVRFGRWNQVLTLPEPIATFKLSGLMRHEARAVAYAAQKKVDLATEEQKKFETGKSLYLASDSDPDNKSVLEIAEHIMNGEILIAQQNLDGGIEQLKQAVKAEDAIPYAEPPTWIQPTRHTLGAAYLEAGKYTEAEAVYRKDLALHPNNGWDLYGLFLAYKGLRQMGDAEHILQEFKSAWKDADFEIGSSCLCIPLKKS